MRIGHFTIAPTNEIFSYYAEKTSAFLFTLFFFNNRKSNVKTNNPGYFN